MSPEAAGRGQHFQGPGHSFSLYGPNPKPANNISFSCGKFAYKWVCLCNFVIELAYAPSANHRKKSNERTSD